MSSMYGEKDEVRKYVVILHGSPRVVEIVIY